MTERDARGMVASSGDCSGPPGPIRVLVVEDSLFQQEMLRQAFDSDPEFKVLGVARTGREALEMAASFKPDIVTLDIILPDMDGLEVLHQLVQRYQVPVMVLSAVVQPDSAVAVEALELGALDCLAKPLDMDVAMGPFRDELLGRMRELCRSGREKVRQLIAKMPPAGSRLALARTLVVIGASAGGPMLLREIIPQLPPDLRAGVLVVQHLQSPFTKQMAVHLAAMSSIRVKEAQAGDVFVDGMVLVAPGDKVLKVEWVRGGWGAANFSASNQSPHRIRPWIDASMATAALLYGRRCIGVILSGMGSDGVEGMAKIKERGGVTIAQDEETSLVYGMPKAAVEAKVVDRVLPLQEIPRAIVESVRAVSGLKP